MARRKTEPKALVVVESPAKAKTINKYLGDEFVVKASLGHVRDLPLRDFGIDVSDGFEPTYEIVRGRAKVVTELKKLASGAVGIYLATDHDREGEAIAWHLVEALDLPAEKVRRVIFNEITRSAIDEAFKHPHKIDMDRVNAQQARRILDRIVGYELSPLLWKKIAKGLSAGRVQSVAVRLIVEREREIRAFVPQESWKISAYFSGDLAAAETLRGPWAEFLRTGDRTQKELGAWLADHGCLRTELADVGGQSFAALTADQAAEVAKAIGLNVTRINRRPWEAYQHLGLEQAEIVGELVLQQGPAFKVSDLNVKRTTTKPPGPFTTATLQQQASTVLRFSASRTMRVAQSLYEGVDVTGEGRVGLITYMRTDSTNISKEALGAVRGLIGEQFGSQYLPEQPNFYGKRQQRAQEAHEAIRPTDPRLSPELVRSALTAEQQRLYELIWKRFVACQMTSAQWDSTSVSISCDTSLGAARFAGSGRKLVFDGFMKVAGVLSDDQLLPHLDQGQAVGLLDLEPKQQFTSPPPRYTEAALVKSLESEGIGRPSTYAAIIDTIQTRGYVEQEERKFYPTALGRVGDGQADQAFFRRSWISSSPPTWRMSWTRSRRRTWTGCASCTSFTTRSASCSVRRATRWRRPAASPASTSVPLCDSPMVYRWSKAGRFLACSAYPRCKGTLNVDRDGAPLVPKSTAHTCDLCDRPMVVRQSRSGHFLGCTGYPECRNTIPCSEDGEPLRLVKEEELKRPCDACGEGELVVKRKGRRNFLGCNRYPECKNTASLPSDVRLEKKPAPPPEEAGLACERCGKPMVLRSGRRGKFVACSGFPKCRHTMPLEKLEEAKAKATAEGKAPPPPMLSAADGADGGERQARWKPGDGPPPGYALTRTGRPVVEELPEPGTLRCPECGSTVEMKRGRFGPFFSCTAFPSCKFNCNLRGAAKKQAEELMPAPSKPKPIPTDILCEECGSPMVIREGRRGKFLGCTGYPKCRGTKELPADFDLEKISAGAEQDS